MPLEGPLRQQLCAHLSAGTEHHAAGERLVQDAQRLWRRIQKYIRTGLPGIDVSDDALELACYALQLPVRRNGGLELGKLGQISLRERTEHAAQLLVALFGEQIEPGLLDRTIRLLQEASQRGPMLDEARLLADVLNLDDFGTLGLILQAVRLGEGGRGLADLIDGMTKREEYGYWQVRLREGFHFEAIRETAERRLEHARRFIEQLEKELREDQ